ncbi:MAG: hypothetical protein AAFP22_00810 [Planctomycetota bacterium]
MLHTLATALLAAPLPAAPPAPNRADVLLDLIPSDSAVVVLANDLATWTSKPEKDYGAWERFFSDPRLLDLVDPDGFDELGEDGVAASMAVLGQVEALAVGVTDPEADATAFAGAMLLTEGYREAWADALEPFGVVLEESELDGQSTVSIVAEGQTVLTLAEIGEAAVFAASEEPADVEALLAERLAALEDGAAVDAWWTDYAHRTDGAVFEVLVDFQRLPVDDPEMEIVLEWMEGIYIGVAVGDGNAGEFSVGLSLVEHPAVESIAAAFGEASVADLGAVPDGATVGTAANVDLLALVYAIMELAEEYAPGEDVQGGFDQAMAFASEAIGIDVEEELLGNLTGDWVFAQWLDASTFQMLVEMDEESDDIPDGFADAIPVMAARLEDPEPYYELIETAVGLLGSIARIDEADTGSTLVVDAVDGITFCAFVNDDWLVLGFDQARVDGFARGAGGAFPADELERLDEATRGSAVSVMSMETVVDILGTVLEAAREDEDLPDEVFEVIDIMGDHLGGSCATDFEIGSDGIVFRTLTF